MTATEELRRMLDERGVEWSATVGANGTIWTHWDAFNGQRIHAMDNEDGTVEIFDQWDLTPEQAIAATLGRGTCKIHDCEGSFSAVNRPVWRCDCGAFMTQYTDATTYHKPRYCPNCGRKVVTDG